MSSHLSMLPSELIVSILEHLPLSSLLAFGATNSSHYQCACRQLKHLNLAILGRKSHSALAFNSKGFEDEDNQHDIFKTTNLTRPGSGEWVLPAIMLREQITAQNKIATEILNRKSLAGLRSLSLIMYDLQSSDLSDILATNLPNLRTLELNFHHPYIHDQSFPHNYWGTAPEGTSSWNAVAGLGKSHEKQLKLRNLRILRIFRAGITSAQLRRMVQSNPALQELHLSNVTGVDQEFVQWLAKYCRNNASLKRISFTNCVALRLQCVEDLAWLGELNDTEISHVNLLGCRDVNQSLISDMIESSELVLDEFENFVNPVGDEFRHGNLQRRPTNGGFEVTYFEGKSTDEYFKDKLQVIEVDPAYLTVT